MTETTTTRDDLPFFTTDLPGIGGAIKQYNEDFLVEEIPRYAASGTGSHVYLFIEKQGLTTSAAIRQIAHALQRKPHEVGYAGLKDAHGVTRQWVSLEHVDAHRLRALAIDRIKILSVTRHSNKIKLGHLGGNRFHIRIRGTVADPLLAASMILDRLATRGVPNFFGPQRFGARGDNAAVGRAVLRGDFDAAVVTMLGRPSALDHGAAERARLCFDEGKLTEAATEWSRRFPQMARLCRLHRDTGGDARQVWTAVERSMQLLYLSAVQSELFNLVLAARINAPDRLMAGDVAWKHANGACFSVDDPSAEQARCDGFEISPTGPLFGRKVKDAQRDAGDVEQRVLRASGLTSTDFTAWSGRGLQGARRPLRAPLRDLAYGTDRDERGPFFWCRFALPPGAYATSVTRELCKS